MDRIPVMATPILTRTLMLILMGMGTLIIGVLESAYIGAGGIGAAVGAGNLIEIMA